MDIYAKEYFDSDQMAMIREGLELGINVETYAKPELMWIEMQKIKEKLENKWEHLKFS